MLNRQEYRLKLPRASARLTYEDGPHGSPDYTYDANGSMICKDDTTAPYAPTYRYDLRGRLQGMDIDGTAGFNYVLENGGVFYPEVEYGYDHAGNRVSKAVATTDPLIQTPTYWLIDNNNPTGYSQVLEEDGTLTPMDQPDLSYVIGNDVVGQATGSTVQYLLYDGHGSTRGLTDAAGNSIVGQNYDYDAFGVAIGFTEADADSSLLYNGERFELILGRYHLRARDFDQVIGRFPTKDPFAGDQYEPLTFHGYAFTHNDPINRMDPTGMFAEWSSGGIGAGGPEVRFGFPMSSIVSAFGSDLAKQLIPNLSGLSLADSAFELARMHVEAAQLQADALGNFAREGVALSSAASRYAFGMSDFIRENLAFDDPLNQLLGFVGARACFIAGTQVVVGVAEDGSYLTRNIEDLLPGDLVLARDQLDSLDDLDLRPVAEVFEKVSDHLRVLAIENVDGAVETIQTTDEHPFWVEGRGWLRARDLQVGDAVDQPDGSDAVVIGTVREAHPEGITVYNFEVEGDHTYFVADGFGDVNTAVWVHNTCVYRQFVNGVWKYVGITGNMARRAAQHLRNGRIVQEIEGLADVPYRVARIIEDKLIKRFGRKLKDATGTLDNINRGIDPRKLPNYKRYEKIADELIKQFIDEMEL